MKRSAIALWVWYRGEAFRGFQVQLEGPTVQGALREALLQVGVAATPAPAGRTDLGVHARMQVISFKAPGGIAPGDLASRLREVLPGGVGVCAATRPPPRFHAQWKNRGKEYRYRFCLGPPPPGWRGCAWRPFEDPRLSGRALMPERVDELLRSCEGERDFIAFHEKSSAQGMRTLESAKLFELGGGLFEARLRGDRFGRYQVRYLVGSAIATAAASIRPERFAEALERGAELDGLKAPAEGLVLWEVLYSPEDDPFTADQRAAAPQLPDEPPFRAGR